MPSMLSAPPYETVHVVTDTYGMLIAQAPGEPTAGKCKLWIIAEMSDVEGSPCRGRLIAYYPDPASGRVVRDDLGLISSADVTSKHWAIETASHGRFTVNVANCLCGAGAVGYAGPVDDRHVVVRVRRDACPWLTVR